jgi:hypothetical protein
LNKVAAVFTPGKPSNPRSIQPTHRQQQQPAATNEQLTCGWRLVPPHVYLSPLFLIDSSLSAHCFNPNSQASTQYVCVACVPIA